MAAAEARGLRGAGRGRRRVRLPAGEARRGAARPPRRCPCEAAREGGLRRQESASSELPLGGAEESALPPFTIKRKAMEELSADEVSRRARGLRGRPGPAGRGRRAVLGPSPGPQGQLVRGTGCY